VGQLRHRIWEGPITEPDAPVAEAPGDRAPSSAARQGDVLVLRDLHKSFGGVHAVAGASFSVPSGRITGLIGPNGAGKSTVVSMIGGALGPDSGEIEFDGRTVTHLPAYRRARLGLVRTYQLSSEFRRLTVLENLVAAAQGQSGERFRVLLQGRRAWRKQERELVAQARALLDRFALRDKEDDYAGNLSGGQKRLLEIARSLMASPVLLLLDEPMAGVNPTFIRTIEQYLKEVSEEGVSMLLIEHELDVVERLCESVIVMARGEVIARGKMTDVRARPEVRNAYLVG
jgi:ABC-type branched-subunit amino acid transport system ATPase component